MRLCAYIHTRTMPQLTASLRPSNTSQVPSPSRLLRSLLQGLLGASESSVTLYNRTLAGSPTASTLALSGTRPDVPFLSYLPPMQDLRFKLESSYGRTRAYPVDQTAILLVRLTRAKTLLPGDIGTFAALGYRCVDQDNNEITPGMLY